VTPAAQTAVALRERDAMTPREILKVDEEWRRLRDEHPVEWQRAVKFDHAVRAADVSLVGKVFVHRQPVPLDEADLRSNDEKQGQLTLTGFANECEGMCGV
jgi:hypothetical protein